LPRAAVKSARPPPRRHPIRVVIAESSRAIREFLAATLAAEDTVQLVDTCSDCGALQSALRARSTDVVITDVRMPPSPRDDGIRIARRLRDTDPRVGVVLLGQYAEPAYLLSVLESGAGRGYLLKERLSEKGELVNAVKTVAAGGIVVDPEVANSLIQARALAATSPLPRLDRAERELLALIAGGKSDAAIAAALAVDERVVTKRLKAIFEKLGLHEPDDARRRAEHVLSYLGEEGG